MSAVPGGHEDVRNLAASEAHDQSPVVVGTCDYNTLQYVRTPKGHLIIPTTQFTPKPCEDITY
jgi:hypothetical protein